ncbi:MAG TPA: ABC transporter permease [Candidatus Polarisedimenticolia bacterium]|nr:ABC transporter permease [Candidatus Polarisedimenticolia bacterium]
MAQPVEIPPDPTIAVQAAEAELPPALIAQTLGQYTRAWIGRMRGGDIGVLPVVVGLAACMIVFEIISPNHVFLSADNLVNLFLQSSFYMVLAMAETFALILGEIDLSIGFLGACGAVIAVQLVQPVTTHWPWWAAIVAALAACALAGAIQGTIVTRLGIPSFIVTLAGYLIFNGVMLILLALGPFSGIPNLVSDDPNVKVLYNLVAGNIDPTISWIVMAVVVVGIGGLMWYSDSHRRRSGLVAPPPSLTLIKIGLIAVAGIVVVGICNVNRANTGYLAGVPWAIPIVLAILGAWTILLERTKYGRYMYAIGGNPEAARRAGINVPVVITIAFALCSMTAAIGLILYASYLGGMSNNVQGGQLVLFAVAAAVIGGTSLFGGRGKAIHGVLGGLVIGAIYNGMYLQSLDVQRIFIVTGLVLLAAVTIDAVSRRGKVSFPGGRR